MILDFFIIKIATLCEVRISFVCKLMKAQMYIQQAGISITL